MGSKKSKKDSAYAMSANSRLASLDFSKAMKWAAKIYQPFRYHESRLSSRDIYQQLAKLLMKVYQSDPEHTVGLRQLHTGNVSLLAQWRFAKHSNWCTTLGISTKLALEPATGSAVLTLPAFRLLPAQLMPMARAMAMRFYVYLLDEDRELLEVKIIEDLCVDIDVLHPEIEAEFDFSPVKNGVLLMIAVSQLHLQAAGEAKVFATANKRYYKASLVLVQAIKNGKKVGYSAGAEAAVAKEPVAKVAWLRK